VDSGHVQRKLAAILAVDVVGYSRLMGIDDESTHVRLKSHLDELVQPKVRHYGGRVIKMTGDGVLAEFQSAVDAVHCGLQIQSGMAQRNSELAPEHQMQFRIGINVGDVIVDGNELYGDGINVAVRVESLSKPDEVYISGAVHEHLHGYSNFTFIDMGEHLVKNIDRPIHVFRVVDRQRAQQTAPVRSRIAGTHASVRRIAELLIAIAMLLSLRSTEASVMAYRPQPESHAPRASIVVLPFTNLGGLHDEDYFADAVTEDVTTDLSRLDGVFVIARETAFTFKGAAVDVRQLGRELNVCYVLEGSVRRVDTVVVTNIQLIDAKSGLHIWADRFDTNIPDLVDLQNYITGRIGESLGIELIRTAGRAVAGEEPADVDAVDLRMRGLALIMQSFTPEHSLAARRLFEEAVRRDPNEADAWSWLAFVLASDYLNRWNNTGQPQLLRAQEAAQHAISIDSNLAQAYLAEGLIQRARGQHEAALIDFDRVLALDPNYAAAYAQKANELINLGRPAEAPQLVDRALALSPLDPFLGVFYWIIGRANFFFNDYREAIDWLAKSVELRPNLTYNRLYLVSAYALVGREPEARRALADFDERFPGYTVARIRANDKDIPNDNPVVRKALLQRDLGLRRAGMADG
jgi:adenylate cyclase